MYLNIFQPVRVSSELWEVLANVNRADLLHQQVCFVEEEDDGDVEEELVVDDGLEYVHTLHQAVCPSVLHQDLRDTHSHPLFDRVFICAPIKGSLIII